MISKSHRSFKLGILYKGDLLRDNGGWIENKSKCYADWVDRWWTLNSANTAAEESEIQKLDLAIPIAILKNQTSLWSNHQTLSWKYNLKT